MTACQIVNRLIESDLADELESDEFHKTRFEAAMALWPQELHDFIAGAPRDFILSIDDPEAFTDYTPNKKDYPVWPEERRGGSYGLVRFYPSFILNGSPGAARPTIAVELVSERVGYFGERSSPSTSVGQYAWGSPEYAQAKARYSYAAWHEARAAYFKHCAFATDDPLSLVTNPEPGPQEFQEQCLRLMREEEQKAERARESVLP